MKSTTSQTEEQKTAQETITTLSENFGPTDTGFIERYYSDIVNSKRNRAIERFGTSIDLTDNSVFGQFINSMSYEEGLIWQILENTYYSRYVQYATGKALDDVVYAKGIFRKAGAKSVGTITITKKPAYSKRIFIPAGATVCDKPDGFYPFITTESVEFEANTTETEKTVPIESVNVGYSYNVPIGTINSFVSTYAGVDSVTNTIATHDGENRESDSELRLRAINYKPGGVGTKESILNALLAITGVTGVNIREYFVQTAVNYTTIDGITLTTAPACSFIACIGGVDEDNTQTILDTIENTRAYGIAGYAVKSQSVSMNVSIKCTYSSSKTQLESNIRTAVTTVLNEKGFGGVVTYLDLMRPISLLEDINTISELKFIIPDFEKTLDDFSDYVDMTDSDKLDKYLAVNEITIVDSNKSA